MSNTVFVHKLSAANAPWRWGIQFDYDPDFIEALKDKIPGRSRRWLPEKKWWVFREEVMDQVLALAYIHVGRVVHVEPDEEEAPVEAYAELHLLPTAPPAVVAAAYKALAKLAHPDKGGDKVKMQRINQAYAQLTHR